MRIVETTFDPSKNDKPATGTVELSGTDDEVQNMLNEVQNIADDYIEADYIVGEFVRVNNIECYEFGVILSVTDDEIEVKDMSDKPISILKTSAQVMGARGISEEISGRLVKNTTVGNMTFIDNKWYEIIRIRTYNRPYMAIVSGNGEIYGISIQKFEENDIIVTPNGIQDTISGHDSNGYVICMDATDVFNEDELESWNEIIAVQRYAASLGMKVNVDVS